MFELVLLDSPSIYDHLLLALRKIDVIATFNWDPLLVQAVNPKDSHGEKVKKFTNKFIEDFN